MRRGRVAVRRRLLVRLLTGALVIAAASIAATAWLAARTTTNALRRSESRSVSVDARVYDALDDFAATHRTWGGVDPLLARLARVSDQRIALTTRGRRRIPGVIGPPASLPVLASAVIDPLQTDALARVGSDTSGINPRALGPFRVSAAQRRSLEREARQAVACMRVYETGVRDPARVVTLPGGRPSLALPRSPVMVRKLVQTCHASRLLRPTPREAAALTRLNRLAKRCLARQGRDPVRIGLSLDFAAVPARDRDCVTQARRSLLGPWVASPALLFLITSPGSSGPLDLTSANRWRVVLVASLVLVLSIVLAAALTARVTRPLRRLADAIAADGGTPVPVTTDDEIGQLTREFNDLTARRHLLEGQRRGMVRDIAHELRGPLTSMRSWLEACEDGLVDSDDHLRGLLLEETRHLQRIVADLADLADLDAGTLALHPEAVAVTDLVATTVEVQRVTADAAGVRLVVDVGGDPTLEADPLRIRQALSNVISNAIRHTEPGGEIAVVAEGHGEWVVLQVRDTGCGIEAADLPRVFDRFWRGDPARGRMTGGSGLGLAITRRLIEAHGGEITVASRVGEGTTVTLRLPEGARPAVPAGGDRHR